MIGLFANHAQRRVAADRLCVVAGGLDLAGSINENTWIDPVTHTLMLCPRPMQSDWYTSNSGPFAKMGLADFSAPGSEWEERQDQHWVGPWLAVRDSASNPPLVSAESFPADVGLSFAWFSYGGGDSFLQARLGWGGDVSGSTDLVLDLYSDGRVDIWRDGVRSATGKISGAKSAQVRRLQVFELMAIPMRGSELLVVSKSGDGFVAGFRDLSGPVTPAGPIWFRCPQGGTQVQIAPVRYPSTGFATSLKTAMLEAPGSDETPELFDNPAWAGGSAPYRVYGWPGGSEATASVSASLTEWDGSTTFIPDGSANEVRLRLDLATGDELFSPAIAGAQIAFAAIPAVTDGTDSVELTPRLLSATLSVPADGGTAILDAELKHDEADRGTVDLSGGGIPVRLDVDGAVTLDGWADPCDEVVGGFRPGRTELVVRDRWAALESAVFADRIPLDGLSLSQAIAAIVAKSGIDPARIVISSSDVAFPTGGARSGDWGLLIEAGDGAAEWLLRLMQTFAPGWLFGFRPASDGTGEEFFALALADLPTTPAITVYASRDEAITDGVAPVDAWRVVAQKVTYAQIAPAANEVRVVGLDPALDRPLVAVRTDIASQTVSSPVESRGAGWAGSIRRFELVDAGLTDQPTIDAVCEQLFAEKCRSRRLVEFQSQLLQHPSGAPLWRGDVVRLHGVGDCRILSLACGFEFEVPGGIHRPAIYVGEMFDEAN